MVDNYSKAYKEVLEILKYVPQESVDKIPFKMIETFKVKMDKDYNFKVDIDKSFEEQVLLEETKAILANIFRDYWATPYQKEKIEEKEKYDRQIAEKIKRQKYNPDDMFKKKQIENVEDLTELTKNLPIEIKKEKFFKKLICFIKKLFKRKS